MNRIFRLAFVMLSYAIVFAILFYLSSGRNIHLFSDDKFRLRVFEATLRNDDRLCHKDKYCLDHMRYYKSLVCIDDVCNSSSKAMKPIDCAPNFAALYKPEEQDNISQALCDVLNKPSAESRRSYLQLVVNETEGEAVELGGYLMAMKGHADACEGYIKQYVGPWGPAWNFQWYRALSGCRILSGKTTMKQEEKDQAAWLRTFEGHGQCSEIENSDMREACRNPGSASPVPVYELLW